MSGKGNRILTVFISFLSLVLTGGCAGNKLAVQNADVEQQQWQQLAERSKGFSPSPGKHEVTISEYKQQIGNESADTEKPLPTTKVRLKLRNTDVKSILRALATAADVNLLLKDDIKGSTSVDFNGAPWDQVFRSVLNAFGLTYVREGDIIRVLTVEDMEQVLKAETVKEKQKALKLSERLADNLSTVVISIDYADAKDLKENIQEFLPKDKDGKPRGSVRVDEHSNALIIQATKADLERMITVIDQIDKPTSQILIRANIVETTKDVARDLGIQWGGIFKNKADGKNIWVTPGGGIKSTTGDPTAVGKISDPVNAGYPPTSGAAGLSGQGFGINFPVKSVANGIGSLGLIYGTLGGNVLEAQLQALQSDGKLNIISSPSITTIDNQKAFAESGERVPYVSTAATAGGVTQDVKFVDAVLRLEITPHVIDGENLKMKIIVKKDEVDTSRSVLGNPFIIKKQTETTLIVRNGETVVISGLTRQRTSENVSGVPGLKDVPVLGWLFKGETKSNNLEEVMIFITPHILPSREEVVKAEYHTTQKNK